MSQPPDDRTTQSSCSSEDEWLQIAAGITGGEKANQMLEHAAGCEHCGRLLAAASDIMAPEVTAEEQAVLRRMESYAPRLAAKLAGKAGPRQPVRLRRLVLAACALAAMVAAVIVFLPKRGAERQLDVLAQAYTKQRTIELRVPGAAFAPMRVARGGGEARVPELLESEAAIERHLAAGNDSAGWLRAGGRAALLEWRYDDAIRELRNALSTGAAFSGRARAETLTDLATAYFERAEATGRTIDYSQALDILGQAIQADPHFAEAYFNRAIVAGKLFLYETARRDWQRYLQLDPSGPWADDARRRLADTNKKTGAARLDEPDRLAGLEEDELEHTLQSGSAEAAAAAFAARWKKAHADPWLAEISAARRAPEVPMLASMARTRATLSVDRYEQEILRLSAMKSPHAAIRAWAAYELLFRLARSAHPQNCVAAAAEAASLSKARGYVWLRGEALLEQATCDLLTGRPSDCDTRVIEAANLAKAQGLPILAMRAAGFRSARLSQLGEFRSANALQCEMLALFWSRPFPFGRAQQFYTDLMWTAEGLSRWHTAVEVARMSAEMAKRAGARGTEAAVRARWAGAAMRAGLTVEARDQAARARMLLAGLDRNPSTDVYRAFAETVSALATENRSALESLRSEMALGGNPLVSASYWRVLARFELRDGKAEQAETALTRATTLFADGALRSRRIGAVAPWRFAYEDALRELLAVMIARGESVAAYWKWQEYLAPAESSASPGGLHAIMLSYIRLGDRYGRWLRRGGDVHFEWVAASADDIDARVRRYAAYCSRPSAGSSANDLLARSLSRDLLTSQLREAPPVALVIQPDGVLAALPWQALPMDNAATLLERFPVAIALDGAPARCDITIPMEPLGRVFAVVSPAVPEKLAKDYLPLPDVRLEAAALRSACPNARVITGSQATPERIDREVAQANAFHFAGHAIAGPAGAQLLVAPAQDGGNSWTPHNLSLRLAVLSACSTARYDEREDIGPQHLAHAMVLAGARQVVAAQWNADSAATAQFMRAFYDGVRGGQGIVECARRAALALRREPGRSHPYYWALFSVFVHT